MFSFLSLCAIDQNSLSFYQLSHSRRSLKHIVLLSHSFSLIGPMGPGHKTEWFLAPSPSTHNSPP